MNLEQACRKVLDRNQQLIEDYDYCKVAIVGALTGHVLKYHFSSVKDISNKLKEMIHRP